MRRNHFTRYPGLAFIVGLLFAPAAFSADDIAALLTGDDPPSGVVFELVQGDVDAVNWAIPRINEYVRRLRDRFPNLDMAVVSHGEEMFALQANGRESYSAAHALVEDLVKTQDVDVHVCGTYADWSNVSRDAFPSYVDVVPAGPIQIRQYRELGFEVIKVTRDRSALVR